MSAPERAAWYWWPLIAAWRAVSAVERRLGIVRSLLLGLGLMALGFLFCLTFVGILAGIPTALAGFLLVLRAMY